MFVYNTIFRSYQHSLVVSVYAFAVCTLCVCCRARFGFSGCIRIYYYCVYTAAVTVMANEYLAFVFKFDNGVSVRSSISGGFSSPLHSVYPHRVSCIQSGGCRRRQRVVDLLRRHHCLPVRPRPI